MGMLRSRFFGLKASHYCATCLLFGVICLSTALAATKDRTPGVRMEAASKFAPSYSIEARTTQVGEIALQCVNKGGLGNKSGRLVDSCFKALDRRFKAPSAEYPRGSGAQFLFTGALWVGAIKGGDTLVTVTDDGAISDFDFLPRPDPNGYIEQFTTRPVLRAPDASLCPDIVFSETAVSEHDLITVFSDTMYWPDDGLDYYYHTPVGLEVTQSVYAWSKGAAAHMNIVKWVIKNVGTARLDSVYAGMFTDFDVYNWNSNALYPYEDDVIGTLPVYPSWLGDGFLDTLNLVWAMDNDGDPVAGGATFDNRSTREVMALRVLSTPDGRGAASFNWWAMSATSQRDWGPNRINSQVEYLPGALGTPAGVKGKYQLMSNGEFDYDQLASAVSHTTSGWLPPTSQTAGIADGADTRCVLGFGPYSMEVDSTVELVIALVGGRRAHSAPTDFTQYWDPYRPDEYTSRLDFEDLARHAVWAAWLYDNPGVDTDGDGYAGLFRMYEGDTVYYRGDEVPDFSAATPPPAPKLAVETGGGNVVIRWNGYDCERTRDRLSLRRDFEGYRVYLSTTGQLYDFAMISQRDLRNYIERRMVLPGTEWLATGVALSVIDFKSQYDSVSIAEYGVPFDPVRFSVPDTAKAFRRIVPDALDPARLDTLYSYFPPVDMNAVVDDSGLAELDALGLDVYGAIRRLHPTASPAESLITHDSIVTRPYYDYEYVIRGLNPVVPAWVAVTAFDHGDPELGADPSESELTDHVTQVWPGGLSQLPEEGRAKPGVYPNPYSVLDDYAGQGWETSGGNPEQSRQITFFNLPDTCQITVWTLDGDLVIKLHHAGTGQTGENSREVWNLLSREEGVLQMGLYIWCVESRFGNDVGKLAVIR